MITITDYLSDETLEKLLALKQGLAPWLTKDSIVQVIERDINSLFNDAELQQYKDEVAEQGIYRIHEELNKINNRLSSILEEIHEKQAIAQKLTNAANCYFELTKKLDIDNSVAKMLNARENEINNKQYKFSFSISKEEITVNNNPQYIYGPYKHKTIVSIDLYCEEVGNPHSRAFWYTIDNLDWKERSSILNILNEHNAKMALLKKEPVTTIVIDECLYAKKYEKDFTVIKRSK